MKNQRIYQRGTPNTLSGGAGYKIAISQIKVIHEIGLFINKKKKLLNKLKIKFLFTMLSRTTDHFFSNLVLCKLNEIKKVSKYLYKYNSIILKLSNLGFKKLDLFLHKDKIISDTLLEYKSKKIDSIKNKFGKLIHNNVIFFCIGRTGVRAMKILTIIGVKTNILIDNNPKFLNQMVDNVIIKNCSYLKKNLNKFSNHKILICIDNTNEVNIIRKQLNKIGFKNKNIIHFNI